MAWFSVLCLTGVAPRLSQGLDFVPAIPSLTTLWFNNNKVHKLLYIPCLRRCSSLCCVTSAFRWMTCQTFWTMLPPSFHAWYRVLTL